MRPRPLASPIVALATIALAAFTSIAAEPRPFTVDDLLAMQRISDPQVAPDQRTIVFALRTTDLEGNAGRFDLWSVRPDGSDLRRLTSDPAADLQPRFSADGQSVFFLSSRGGSMQVWRLPLSGGEAVPVTDLPVDVENLLVFPDGERLLVSLEVHPDSEDLAASAERDRERDASKVKARVYDALPFRHWDQWEDGKRSHWFVVRIDGSAPPLDLMKGMDCDSPTKPFGGAEQATIAPDSRSVVFTAKHVGREAMWSTDLDLYLVPADGSAAPHCITEENAAVDDQPAFAPDGRTLGYLAMARPGYEADRLGLTILDLATMERRAIAPQWDRSIGSFAFDSTGDAVHAVADHVGNTALFRIDLDSGAVETLVARGSASSPLALGSGVAFLWNDLTRPDEIQVIDGGERRAVTAINGERCAGIAFGAYEQFAFQGAHDETVHGYVMKPARFEAGRKYPVAFLIHGGPQGSFSDRFHYRWNPQVYAGAGYAAVFIDFHGSTGYGQAFTDSIRGDWGGKPYEDLMKGLDAALERYDYLDGSRVAALGASYGGYMINWIAGQTDRFRCLVNHDGNLDERMAYFDTEELWFPEWEHGLPWEDPAAYAKHNPIDHVAKWKTPMLVIHGALDYRVVDTQGMSTFTALQRRGIPSRFLHFPDENHWVLKPQNSRLWHSTVLEWLGRWTTAP
jgi:dipeptidyl aminopeptidase/acylaminoacyl peptidase